MSMKFAGFMAAAREDRLLGEKRDHEEAMQEKKFEQDLKLLGITEYQKQKLKDQKLAKDVGFVMDALGLPSSARSAAAGWVESLGADAVISMYQSGKLEWNGGDMVRQGSGSAGNVSWNGSPSENANIAYDFFISQGETPEMAAGIVGNLMQESGVGLDPYAVGDDGNAWGIAQMNGPRRKAMKKWATDNGKNVWDIQTQLEWMYAEMEQEPAERANWEKARNAATPEEAASILSNEYWRPGTPHIENRKSYATKMYTARMDDIEGSQNPIAVAAISDTTPEIPGGNYNLGQPVGSAADKETDEVFSTRSSSPEGTPAPYSGNSGSSGRSGFVIKRDTPDDPMDVYGEQIGKADSPEKIIALRGQIEGDSDLQPGQRGRLIERLDRQEQRFVDEDTRTHNLSKAKTPDWFADELGEATTLEKLDRLGAKVRVTSYWDDDPEGRMEAQTQIRKEINLAQERLIDEARADGDFVTFAPYAPDGTLSSTGSKQIKWVRDHWEDADGKVVTASSGKILPQEGIETAYKLHNTSIRGVTDFVANGVQAANTIVNLRQNVIENPASVNKYVAALGAVTGELQSLFAAAAATAPDGKYHYEEMQGILGNFAGLSAEAKAIASQQLYAAYALAAMNGSSGQALSDKELAQNLQAVGFGETNPKRLVARLNKALKENVVEAVEFQRGSRIKELVLPEDVKVGLSGASFMLDFRDHLEDEFLRVKGDEGLKQLEEALRGKDDYDYIDSPGDDETETVTEEADAGDEDMGTFVITEDLMNDPDLTESLSRFSVGQTVRLVVRDGRETLEAVE